MMYSGRTTGSPNGNTVQVGPPIMGPAVGLPVAVPSYNCPVISPQMPEQFPGVPPMCMLPMGSAQMPIMQTNEPLQTCNLPNGMNYMGIPYAGNQMSYNMNAYANPGNASQMNNYQYFNNNNNKSRSVSENRQQNNKYNKFDVARRMRSVGGCENRYQKSDVSKDTTIQSREERIAAENNGKRNGLGPAVNYQYESENLKRIRVARGDKKSEANNCDMYGRYNYVNDAANIAKTGDSYIDTCHITANQRGDHADKQSNGEGFYCGYPCVVKQQTKTENVNVPQYYYPQAFCNPNEAQSTRSQFAPSADSANMSTSPPFTYCAPCFPPCTLPIGNPYELDAVESQSCQMPFSHNMPFMTSAVMPNVSSAEVYNGNANYHNTQYPHGTMQ